MLECEVRPTSPLPSPPESPEFPRKVQKAWGKGRGDPIFQLPFQFHVAFCSFGLRKPKGGWKENQKDKPLRGFPSDAKPDSGSCVAGATDRALFL